MPSTKHPGCDLLVKSGQACYGAENCGKNAQCRKGVCECLYGVNEEQNTCNYSNKLSNCFVLLFMTILLILFIK